MTTPEPFTLTIGRGEAAEYNSHEKFLDGRLHIASRDGLRSADRAIIPMLSKGRKGHALVINPAGLALAYAVRINNPEMAVTAWYDDAWDAARARDILTRHPMDNIEIIAAADAPAGPFEYVVMPLQQRGLTDLVRERLRLAATEWLKPQGLLFSSSDNPNDKFIAAEIRKAFGSTHAEASGSRKKGAVGYVSKRPAKQLVAPPRTTSEFTVMEAGEVLTFGSRLGVFCHDRLDDGTRALLAVAEIPEDSKRILDLGSGCGVVGVVAARRAPEAHITFVDSNLRAVEASRANVEAFGLTDRATILSSENPEQVLADQEQFDVILTNPPYYGNQRIAEAFVTLGQQKLAPGGILYIVTKSLEFYREHLVEWASFEETKRGGYFIIRAQHATETPIS